MRQQAGQRLQAVALQVKTELTGAYQAYQVQQEQVQRYEGMQRQSGQMLDNIRYAYLRGGTTIIDLLEAQRSWLDTQQAYYEVLLRYRQSYLQLLYAAGLINQL